MEKRTTRFLNISLALVSLFCIVIFIGQTVAINVLGENTIRQLGVFYMSGMSEQVSSHFGTIIELRLSQVEFLVNSVPPSRSNGDDTVTRVSLTYHARSAGFDYLAYYMEDGTFRMIYGAQIKAVLPESLRRSVLGGKNNVAAGTDESGTPIALIGVPAHYPVGEKGETSMALVACLPVSYLSDSLGGNVYNNYIEYSILRDDGSYVLHNMDTEDSNYFDRVANLYEPCNGKQPEQYIQELHTALEEDRDYSSDVIISGERWNIYCTKLPNAEWHLLLKIPHSTLDETVNILQHKWSSISIGGCCLIIFALLLVFVGYYRLTKMQMKALDEARKTAERAQQLAERSNRAKNEFLSNMSHDIRTPMNGIMGMTSIAIGNLDDPPRVRSCLKRIHISSRHLLGLINDMLDMSKIESGNLILNMEPISLREVMQNITTIIQPQIQEKKQQFNIYVHEIYHENVCSDRVRLSQILLNILGNAVKFTQDGGSIEANLYEEPSPKGPDYIRSRLDIKDNGIGMSKEFLDRIFDPFAREDSARVDKTAGAGMGMTITKYIVDAMGGTITVNSEQGRGSNFCITLDMENSTRQDKELLLPERSVLVVDDDETAGALAVEALTSIGLRAEAAFSTEQAFQMVMERKEHQNPYHLILLDWDIHGQDIIQTVQEQSHRLQEQLPIVLLTDGEWDEVEARAEAAGIRGFISKPLFRSSLYYGLRPFLEEKPVQPEPEESGPPDLTGRRILMAEDNELNREIACELLCECGLEVEWAENGKICLEKFENSSPEWYDAILMDLRMPVMTGFEATQAIRSLDRDDAQAIPIIAVSADAFEEDIRKCLEYGMNAHTPKPLDPDAVLELLSQYIY